MFISRTFVHCVMNPMPIRYVARCSPRTEPQPRVSYVRCDVRQPLDSTELPRQVDLIVNLAAVHREPGHNPQEYYETNLPGAEHVCAYATAAQCRQIVFTSSISPYGAGDAVRNEDSLPMPETAYGGSKLVAEKIHIAWQEAQSDRRLIVLRPGVVFGPGEHANVARLARSLARGYFVYMGNRETRKAGVYVKELCHVMEFALEYQERTGEPMLLWNVSMDPPPKLEQFVDAICSTTGFARPRFSVPRNLLVAASYPVAAIAQLFGMRPSIDPVRMRKLSQPTNIEPQRLREAGYRFRYTMEAGDDRLEKGRSRRFHPVMQWPMPRGTNLLPAVASGPRQRRRIASSCSTPSIANSQPTFR